MLEFQPLENGAKVILSRAKVSISTFACCALTAALFGLGLATSTGEAAGTALVSNKNDSGAGSLRQAISNVDAGGTVKFKQGLRGTIQVLSPLEIDKDLTIQGPGSDLITLNGGGETRLVVIGSTTGGSSVEISGLTFTKGVFNGSCGDVGENEPCGGGAISAEDLSSLRVTDSVFRMNASATDGAAVIIGGGSTEIDASATFIRTEFLRNVAYDDSGGIAMYGTGAITVRDSEFVNNAGDGGGAALLVEPYFDSPTGSDQGGAVTITGTEFDSNGAQSDSDGPAVRTDRWSGPTTIDESLFYNGAADDDGGGLYSESLSSLVITDSLFFGNNVDDKGSAIAYYPFWSAGSYGPIPEGRGFGEVRIERTDFLENVAENNGAVYLRPNTDDSTGNGRLDAVFRDVDFTGNFAYASSTSSALEIEGDSDADDEPGFASVLIERTDFNRNMGGEGGWALNLTVDDPTETTIRQSSIVNSGVGDAQPSALRIQNAYQGDCPFGPDCKPSTTTIVNSTIAGNESAQSNVGAVQVDAGNNVSFDSSTIALNVTATSGGSARSAGLYLSGNNLVELENSIVADNVAAGSPTSLAMDCYVSSPSTSSLELTGANLIGVVGNDCPYTGADPLTGNPGLAVDPVRVKRTNGDTTWVVPLLRGSKALNASEGSPLARDQRGVPRPQFSAADLGAYELAPSPIVKLAGAPGLESAQVEVSCGSARACKLRVSGFRNLSARVNDPVTETVTVSLKRGQKKTVTLPYTEALANSILRARREGRVPVLHIVATNSATMMQTKVKEKVTASPDGTRQGPRRPVNTG